MRYRGTLIVVKNCAQALTFYKNVLRLELLQDNDGNMELSAGWLWAYFLCT